MKHIWSKLCDRVDLSEAESAHVFGKLIAGALSGVEISALLMGLRTKGETVDELVGAARALRRAATRITTTVADLADTCGTGGDGAGTINVSTGAALVAATMGIKVAKHGNRSVSSTCGSADVLEQLGVSTDISPGAAVRCLEQVGICFLLAPAYHGGLRHAGPIRSTLGVRTVMNLLGPLVNPLGPRFQVVGVFDPDLCEKMAWALVRLGCHRGLVVHGGGLDEIAVHGPTRVAMIDRGAVSIQEITPGEMGLSTFPLEALRGGKPEENGVLLLRILAGEGSDAGSAAIAANAGALAWISGRATSLREGTARALEVISGGTTLGTLRRLGEVSSGS